MDDKGFIPANNILSRVQELVRPLGLSAARAESGARDIFITKNGRKINPVAKRQQKGKSPKKEMSLEMYIQHGRDAGFTDIAILKNAGVEVRSRSAHPLVRDRINAVNTKLKNANGMSSLFIVNSCRNLIKSVERQVYKENTHVPDKESGYAHFNDALGYFIEYVYPLRRDFKPTKPTRWS